MADPINPSPRSATVYAPATIANIAVGFDVLGFAFDGIGDRVTVERSEAPGVRITAVAGQELPLEPAKNTAGAALLSMIEDLDLGFGFDVRLQKGIPLSSGLGGSAASAVGAVVAAAQLIDTPRSKEQLLPYALAGEAVASGAIHGDNVAPCLFGGLVAVLPGDPMPAPVRLPEPDLLCVLVRPDAQLDTKTQRQVLPASISLAEHTRQSAYLAGFVSAVHAGDLDLMRACMQDLIIGPCRAATIPGFAEMYSAAMDAGAIGCGIAGSGPTVFAWCETGAAPGVHDAMNVALSHKGVIGESWWGLIGGLGARVVAEAEEES